MPPISWGFLKMAKAAQNGGFLYDLWWKNLGIYRWFGATPILGNHHLMQFTMENPSTHVDFIEHLPTKGWWLGLTPWLRTPPYTIRYYTLGSHALKKPFKSYCTDIHQPFANICHRYYPVVRREPRSDWGIHIPYSMGSQLELLRVSQPSSRISFFDVFLHHFQVSKEFSA